MWLNNSQDENLTPEDSSGLGDAGSNLYDNVSEATKNNQPYLCVGGQQCIIMHSQAKGFVETPIKQKSLN